MLHSPLHNSGSMNFHFGVESEFFRRPQLPGGDIDEDQRQAKTSSVLNLISPGGSSEGFGAGPQGLYVSPRKPRASDLFHGREQGQILVGGHLQRQGCARVHNANLTSNSDLAHAAGLVESLNEGSSSTHQIRSEGSSAHHPRTIDPVDDARGQTEAGASEKRQRNATRQHVLRAGLMAWKLYQEMRLHQISPRTSHGGNGNPDKSLDVTDEGTLSRHMLPLATRDTEDNCTGQEIRANSVAEIAAFPPKDGMAASPGTGQEEKGIESHPVHPSETEAAPELVPSLEDEWAWLGSHSRNAARVVRVHAGAHLLKGNSEKKAQIEFSTEKNVKYQDEPGNIETIPSEPDNVESKGERDHVLLNTSHRMIDDVEENHEPDNLTDSMEIKNIPIGNVENNHEPDNLECQDDVLLEATSRMIHADYRWVNHYSQISNEESLYGGPCWAGQKVEIEPTNIEDKLHSFPFFSGLDVHANSEEDAHARCEALLENIPSCAASNEEAIDQFDGASTSFSEGRVSFEDHMVITSDAITSDSPAEGWTTEMADWTSVEDGPSASPLPVPTMSPDFSKTHGGLGLRKIPLQFRSEMTPQRHIGRICVPQNSSNIGVIPLERAWPMTSSEKSINQIPRIQPSIVFSPHVAEKQAHRENKGRSPTFAIITIALDVQFHTTAGKLGSRLRSAFEGTLKRDLAIASGWEEHGHGGLPPSNFRVRMVAPGSVVADVEILADPLADMRDPWDVAADLQRQVRDPRSLLLSGILTKHTTSITSNLPKDYKSAQANSMRRNNEVIQRGRDFAGNAVGRAPPIHSDVDFHTQISMIEISKALIRSPSDGETSQSRGEQQDSVVELDENELSPRPHRSSEPMLSKDTKTASGRVGFLDSPRVLRHSVVSKRGQDVERSTQSPSSNQGHPNSTLDSSAVLLSANMVYFDEDEGVIATRPGKNSTVMVAVNKDAVPGDNPKVDHFRSSATGNEDRVSSKKMDSGQIADDASLRGEILNEGTNHIEDPIVAQMAREQKELAEHIASLLCEKSAIQDDEGAFSTDVPQQAPSQQAEVVLEPQQVEDVKNLASAVQHECTTLKMSEVENLPSIEMADWNVTDDAYLSCPLKQSPVNPFPLSFQHQSLLPSGYASETRIRLITEAAATMKAVSSLLTAMQARVDEAESTILEQQTRINERDARIQTLIQQQEIMVKGQDDLKGPYINDNSHVTIKSDREAKRLKDMLSILLKIKNQGFQRSALKAWHAVYVRKCHNLVLQAETKIKFMRKILRLLYKNVQLELRERCKDPADAVLPDIGFDFEDVSHDDFVAENQA